MLSSVRPRDGFALLGVFCTLLGVQHLLLEGESVGTLLEALIILALTGLVFYTAYELPARDISVSGQWRALELGIGTAVAFALLAALVWGVWLLEGTNHELSFLISFATTLGSAVGTRGSIYAVEAEERLTEANELATLLSINQRVLRHNIRNELAVALGHLDSIESSTDAAEIEESLTVVRRHLEALTATSDRTRRIISIWETDSLEETDLVEVVERQVARSRDRSPDVPITTDLPDHCRVTAHPALALAIDEALCNAVEHNPPDVALSVSIRHLDDGNVRLEISDTGWGIPESERVAIEGSVETPLEHTEGVGLWMIYWTVRTSGGTIEFADNDPQGTTVRIVLPAAG